jgi:opacity protein-like surface antigen
VGSIEHTSYRRHLVSIILGAMFVSDVPVQGVAETADNSDAWQFEITPYLFAAGLEGQAGVRGVTADVDMSFNDIWDNLDSAFMGLFTAQRGPWIYGIEGVYFKITDVGSTSVTGPFGNVTVDGALKLTTSINVYQGSVGYSVYNDTTLVDLIGAVRYTQVKADMNVAISTTPGIIFPGNTLSAGGSEDWIDGVLGLRVLHPVLGTVSLLGYADIGEGGSDLTYQLIAGVNWEFAKDITAKTGYRILNWDYKNADTVWDMQASGMYLGVGFKF